jgi:hypothetical protein
MYQEEIPFQMDFGINNLGMKNSSFPARKARPFSVASKEWYFYQAVKESVFSYPLIQWGKVSVPQFIEMGYTL